MENQIMTMSAWRERSDSLAKFAPAFLKLQSELEPVKKDAFNPHFKNHFADLSATLEAVQPMLTANQFMFFQEPGNLNNMLAMTTTLMHVSGEYIRSTVAFPVSKPDPQGFCSAITYARRYSFKSIIGLPEADDDGNAASNQGQSVTKSNPSPQRQAQAKPQATKSAIPLVWDGSELIDGGDYKGKPWKLVKADDLEAMRHTAKKPENRTKAEKEISRREEAEQSNFEATNHEAENAGGNDSDYDPNLVG